MDYPGHDIPFLQGLTTLELKNRQRTLTAELRDPKSTRSAAAKVKMQKDLVNIEGILKLRS